MLDSQLTSYYINTTSDTYNDPWFETLEDPSHDWPALSLPILVSS